MKSHALLALIAVLGSAGSHSALAANTTPSAPTEYVCSYGLLGLGPFLQNSACSQPAQLAGTVFAAHVKNSTGSLAPTIDIGSNWIQVGSHTSADLGSTYDTTFNFATAFKTTPVCVVSAQYPVQESGLNYAYAEIISTSTTNLVVSNAIDSDLDYSTAESGSSFSIICTTGQ